MFNVQMNERGQITIPKALRDKANLNPKDNLVVDIDEKGRLILTKKNFFSDLEDLIRRDLVSEGFGEYEILAMMPQKPHTAP